MSAETRSLTTGTGLALSLSRLAEPDIDAVMALEASAHSHPWRRSSFEDCLKGRHQCWLAHCDGNLVGYVVFSYGGGDAELLNIAVSPEWQRQGIAQSLLTFTVEQVSAHADMLFLEVRVSNRKAIELYYKLDFFETGQRRNYYPTANGREDALLMACQLS